MTAEQRIIAEFAAVIADLKLRLRAIKEASDALDEIIGGSETARLISRLAGEACDQ